MKTLMSFVAAFAVLGGNTYAQQSGAMPDNIAKEFAFFVGDWTVEGDLAGKTLKGRWCAQWAPETQCLLVRSHYVVDGEQVSSNGISGWDAGKEEVVTVQYFSNGVLEDIRYKLVSPGVLKGVYSLSSGGESQKVDCDVRKKEPNEWTFKSTVNVF